MSAHWSICFSGYQANGRGRREWRVGEWALCSDLDTRKGKESALPREELILPSQALPAAWLAASRWLPLQDGKFWHHCLFRVMSKSTIVPRQELQAATAFPRCWLSVQLLWSNKEHNIPVRRSWSKGECWDEALSLNRSFTDFWFRSMFWRCRLTKKQ